MHKIGVRLLGSLEVTYGALRLTVPAGRPQALLATLSVRHGELVTVDEIAARLWDDDPPGAARTTVRGHVKRLRKVLDSAQPGADSVIDGGRGGYRLSAGRTEVDVTEFRRLMREATGPGLPAGPEAEVLDRALALWRGPVLAGIDAPALQRDEVPPLEELRLRAVHRRVAIGIDEEDPGDHIPLLRRTLARDPLQERFWAQLILALYRSGRPAEALREYDRCRRLLGDRLGVDPGPELAGLHQKILTGSPDLAAPPRRVRRTASVRTTPVAAPVAASPGGRPVPRQLPSCDTHFVGRDAELGALDDVLLPQGGPHAADAGRVLLLDGPAGVGKTALAVHWANRRRDRFPDGQLYLDLDGFSTGRPMHPDDALQALLMGLGAAADRLPSRTWERGALLRTALADRRVLLVLDNVRSPEQVRPLLPGAAGTALITSRSRLRSLVVRGGAHRLTLDPLGPSAATALLGELLADGLGGRGGPVAPEVLRELGELCGGLPLALRILAEQGRHRPDVTLPRLAARLRGGRGAQDVFRLGEDSTDLRTVMSWSLRDLTEGAARLHEALEVRASGATTSVGPADAAAVLGVPRHTAARLLDELVQVHLLEHQDDDRYRLRGPFPSVSEHDDARHSVGAAT
ncbi:AfsR/SARP family transcriptional regulator [Streptomyces griseochromogenes]|uniref:AfsR/SARP family transcriptional regulator n=1 Tax=Streptomyces griseochromogenes TaxID=68214 RepID=UPI0037B0192D